MSLRQVSLEDRLHGRGTVLLNGTQALVRLLLLQRELDAARGLNTAGYVSGYRGSPLGGLDQQLWRARGELESAGIRFHPGVNEDLAATAIWGTQQAPLLPGPRVQGVFALWYGKGPGVDRSGDPFKHGNRMGTSPHGGVLAAAGDDHTGKSSTVSHQSEQAMVAAGMPVLYPATVQDILDLGILGWALSRYAGAWVGFKCVNESVETTATVQVDPGRIHIVAPEGVALPPGGLHARIAFDPLGDEMRLQRYKLPAAQAFARANGLDRLILGEGPRHLGIVSAGKSAIDVSAALALLGIDAARARELGIRVYRPGMIWPLEPEGLREFARGCHELLVIEEKAAFLEPQVARILYNLPGPERPRLIGKTDESGATVLPSDVALDPLDIALLILQRLQALGIDSEALAARAGELQARRSRSAARDEGALRRTPYFCSGCPHNTSTRVPDGSLALSGIGCHTLAISMERRTLPPTQMGGEGMNWAGIAPFSETPHVFQNIGDGTYFHSGLLAIRAAQAAGVNITYKLLVNDAVAMTGGQPVEGGLTVADMSRQLAAEGVTRIALVSDDPRRWRRRRAQFAPGTTFHDRAELDRVQRELRGIPGVTAILYEQTCAAEKRRRRKRGLMPDPERRVFINAEVCEGCGDCSAKSNCLSVEPLETELGRKRRINQSSCNKDYSCANGFCPSFVLVEGAQLRRAAARSLDPALFAELPEPPRRAGPCNLLIAGIGGTGVVTIGAVLAMAAHLEDEQAAVFDMTGLAQKGGAVLSHLRLGGEAGRPAGLLDGEADLILGCDLVVAAGPDALRSADPGRTRVVVNTHLAPVAQFQRQRDFDFHEPQMMQRLQKVAVPEGCASLDATGIAERLLGDAIATNMLMTGYASQSGLLPVSAAAIERAIELNGAAVELNRTAFRVGRLLRHAPGRIESLLPGQAAARTSPLDLEGLIEDRARRLAAYQDAKYAARYRELVGRVRAAERASGAQEALARAVAGNYYRLLAYKDEYEVARLYTDGRFRSSLDAQFAQHGRIRILLAPPLLARRDAGGEPRKIAFGGWVLPLMRLLAQGRRLRGTPFDPFGYTAERRAERALIAEYEAHVTMLLARLQQLGPERWAVAVEIASVPEGIRGFGHVKAQAIGAARRRWQELVAKLSALGPAATIERAA